MTSSHVRGLERSVSTQYDMRELDRAHRSSFNLQIAELSLRIFIPLNRLVSPHPASLAPRVSSFLSLSYENPLEYFERSQNLIRFQSILRVLEKRWLGPMDGRRVITLSRYFEALSVNYGTLTSSYWTFSEDSFSLTIWSMISYYNHCVEKFSSQYPHILSLINDRLVEALKKDTPIFQEIYRCEESKEQLHYLIFRRFELQVRKFYELAWEQQACEDNPNFWGMSRIANFPENRELMAMKDKKALSLWERYELCRKVWNELASSCPEVAQQVMVSKEVMEIREKISSLIDEVERRESTINRRAQRASLNTVKRALQSLYEHEQLQIGLVCTQGLLQGNEEDQGALIQWIVVLRESLKLMVTDCTLNLTTRNSLSKYTDVITTIRDYYEHPEDYVLVLDFYEDTRKKKQRKRLETNLFQELKAMSEEVTRLMQIRLTRTEGILKPRDEIKPEDAYEALTQRQRDTQQERELSDAREVTLQEYPAIKKFCEKIANKKNRDRLKGIDARCLFAPIPRNMSQSELVELLQEKCQALQSLTNLHNRASLEKMISEDPFFRLKVQHRFSEAVRFLGYFINHRSKDFCLDGYAYSALENVYFEAKEARNFQTHDLWRTDVQGITNAVYLLGCHCPPILARLLKPTPFDNPSFEAEVLQKVTWGKLSQEGLSQFIKEGFDLNAYDYKCRTILHYLADHPSKEHLQLAKFVVENGGDIHYVDYAQRQPLHYAVASDFFELVQFLIDQGAVADSRSIEGTPTEIAQSHNHTAITELLSAQRGVHRSTNSKALLDAVLSLDVKKVRRLIGENYDPQADYEGSLPLVALFRKEWVDPCLQIELANILFQAGADIDQQEPGSGESALHAAAGYTDKKEIIKFLMDLSPNVNLRTKGEQTPLHCAVYVRHEGWADALLKAGALVDEKDSWGNTPLLAASNMGNPAFRIIKLLLEYGASVEAENEYGRVLHDVADIGGDQLVALVLKYGASPFILGRGGICFKKMPFQLSKNPQVRRRLIEKMQFLFSHLSKDDQKVLAPQLQNFN